MPVINNMYLMIIIGSMLRLTIPLSVILYISFFIFKRDVFTEQKKSDNIVEKHYISTFYYLYFKVIIIIYNMYDLLTY